VALVARVFLDTSVLLGGLIELGPASAPSHRILTAVANGRLKHPLTAWHCCLEFYAVSTRLPEELRLTPGDALKLLAEEILARFQIHQLPGDRHLEFFQVVAHERIAGGRLYDAHIAEIARAARARVAITENRRHFSGLLRHGIRVLTAAEFVEDSGL
jgi:predicted nucleic acid-binding protein